MPARAFTGNCHKLYKKQPNLSTPRPAWLAAIYAHVIHSRFHSFRGQVEMRKATPHKALRAKQKFFCLTRQYQLCRTGHRAR